MLLVTDYFVIGAGAAAMAFVDTLLTEQPNATFAIVDKHPAPGGHWNDAYDFVHLHQPSLLYGVASRQLEGSWLSLTLRGTLPWKHRASKQEILSHYKSLMDDWTASGRVQYFPSSTYIFDSNQPADAAVDGKKVHAFVNNTTNETRKILVQKKLVNAVLGECKVPSQTAPEFPVDSGVPLRTPNQIFEDAPPPRKPRFFGKTNTDFKKYIVLGCGKTALDTVVFLQREKGVPASHISWVAPNDIWMLRRSGSGSPWSWGDALLECDGDPEKAALMLEEKKVFARLDETVMPTKFRFPVVGDSELELCRRVKNMIRRGRVSSIESLPDGSSKLLFTKSDEPMIFSGDHAIIHCTSPGPFNSNTAQDIFPDDDTVQLLFLYAPPVPISMSCIASLESRLQQGTLDLEFARKLLPKSEKLSDRAVLNSVLPGYKIAESDDTTQKAKDHIEPIKILAVFLAILDRDPLVGHKWLQANRLSFFSVPGFKGRVVENLERLQSASQALKYEEKDIRAFQLLAEKLEPLRKL